jgi:hypothetical protein
MLTDMRLSPRHPFGNSGTLRIDVLKVAFGGRPENTSRMSPLAASARCVHVEKFPPLLAEKARL